MSPASRRGVGEEGGVFHDRVEGRAPTSRGGHARRHRRRARDRHGVRQELRHRLAPRTTAHEIETLLDGKHRDFNVDTKGKLLVVEEETSLDRIPAAARAAILQKVASGKLRSVEAVTKPGGETM